MISQLPAPVLQEGLAWSQLIQFGPTVVLAALILWGVIRLAPIWKEVRLREIDLRMDENVVKGQQAAALGQLAGALTNIAVEQRKATEEVRILSRVNADSADELSLNVRQLSQRVDVVQQRLDNPSPSFDQTEKRQTAS